MDARTVEGQDALSFRDNIIADVVGKDIATTKGAVCTWRSASVTYGDPVGPSSWNNAATW